MIYRDDGDALLERIAALEVQAARVERLERRVRELEQENHLLREAARVASGSSGPPVSTVARPAAAGADRVYVDDKIRDYVAALLAATRAPGDGVGPSGLAEHVLSGARPDDAEAVLGAARAHAIGAGRPYVTPGDVRIVAPGVLRDRVILSARAAQEGVTVEALIGRLFEVVEVP